MGETRRENGRSIVGVSTRDPEWVELSTDPTVGPVTRAEPAARPWVVLAAVVGAIAAVVALLGLTGAVEIEPPPEAAPVDPIVRTPTTRSPAPTAAPTTTEVPPPDLGPAPAEWLDGLALAFVDDNEELQLFDLATGSSVVGNQWAEFAWPPLPDSVRLLGAPNRSFAIDPSAPTDSGRISTTVHTVRLSEQNDQFGFFSESEDGFQFFVGSQWGPAQNGLATAPVRAQVFAVPGRGIIVSEPDGSSQVLTTRGLEQLPTRLGRVVDATADRMLGVHCDDLGRCVGRLMDWDLGNEIEIPVAFAANNTVSLSPNGRHLLSANTSEWGVYDIETGGFAVGDPRVVPQNSVAWTPDGARVVWVERGVVVTASADRDLVAFAVPSIDLDADRRVADRGDMRIVSLF
jgi:hypothetical protein